VEDAINGSKGSVVRIFPEVHALSHAAADVFRTIADEAVQERGRFAVALSGGSTPKELYMILGNKPYADRIDWERIHLFWADERCVPPEHGDSNFRLARELLISRVPIPGENIHRIRGEAGAEKAAAAYEQDLKAYFGNGDWPSFDLAILGTGEDGHTASLFPGFPQVQEQRRLAAPVFAGAEKRDRVTLTLPVLNHARRVLFLVAGPSKSRIVRSILRDGNPDGLPAGLVQPAAGVCTWFLDEDAAASLSQGRQA
jgi:6-phosphogluconolactonase